MDEKQLVAKILSFIMVGDNYEKSFPSFFDLMEIKQFTEKGVLTTSGKELDNIMGIIKIAISQAVKFNNKLDVKQFGSALPTFVKEYNLWHIGISAGRYQAIAIVFTGIHKGVLQIVDIETGDCFCSRMSVMLKSPGDTVN